MVFNYYKTRWRLIYFNFTLFISSLLRCPLQHQLYRCDQMIFILILSLNLKKQKLSILRLSIQIMLFLLGGGGELFYKKLNIFH